MELNEIAAALKSQQDVCLINLHNEGVMWMTKHVHYSKSHEEFGRETAHPYIILHRIKEKPGHPAHWSHEWTTIKDGADLYLLLPFLVGEYAKPFDVSAAVGQILKEEK